MVIATMLFPTPAMISGIALFLKSRFLLINVKGTCPMALMSMVRASTRRMAVSPAASLKNRSTQGAETKTRA